MVRKRAAAALVFVLCLMIAFPAPAYAAEKGRSYHEDTYDYCMSVSDVTVGLSELRDLDNGQKQALVERTSGYLIYKWDYPYFIRGDLVSASGDFSSVDWTRAGSYTITVKLPSITDSITSQISYTLKIIDDLPDEPDPGPDPAVPPAMYRVTVRFLEEGTGLSLKDDYISPEMEEGSSFTIGEDILIPPENYEVAEIQGDLQGIIDKDRQIIVVCRKLEEGSDDPLPIDPDDPNPVDPDDPKPINPDGPGPVDPDGPGPVDPDDPSPVDPDHPGPVDPDDPKPVDPDDPGPVGPDDPEPVDPDHPGPVDPDDPKPIDPDDPGPVNPDDPKPSDPEDENTPIPGDQGGKEGGNKGDSSGKNGGNSGKGSGSGSSAGNKSSAGQGAASPSAAGQGASQTVAAAENQNGIVTADVQTQENLPAGENVLPEAEISAGEAEEEAPESEPDRTDMAIAGAKSSSDESSLGGAILPQADIKKEKYPMWSLTLGAAEGGILAVLGAMIFSDLKVILWFEEKKKR